MSSSYIDSINQAATASTAKTSGSSSGSSTTKSGSAKEAAMGKEDFLTLLVTQLQNQDPLNPDNPTEFTAQLAQFSSLEQLFTLNDSMKSLVTSNTNSDRLSTLNTIGKDVAYNSGDFKFSGEPVTIGYQLDSAASDVTVNLQLNGATIKSFKGTELTAGNHYLNWDGKTDSGVAAPNGNYKIVLSAKAPDGQTTGAAPLIKSEVTGVSLNASGGATLMTKAGEIAYYSILGVYDPGSSADTTITTKQTDTSATTAKSATDTSTAAASTAASLAETAQTVAQAVQ